jgi:hypothetical protein
VSEGSSTSVITETILQIVENKKPANVKQLIALLKEQIQVSEEQALDLILKLDGQGKIKFLTHPLPPSFKLSLYLKTNQARWYWVTAIFALVTSIVVFAVPENLEPWNYSRNIMGSIFVLYLPGYTLLKTLFPKADEIKIFGRDFDRIERIVLSLCLSLVLVPIVILLLDYAQLGIELAPILLSLLAFSLVFATIGLIREYQAKTETEFYKV